MSSPCPCRERPLHWMIALTMISVASSFPLASADEAAQVSNHQLFAIRPDGSEVKQITNDPTFRFGSAYWSPDGKQIAADRAPANQNVQATDVVVMDADGSNLRELGPGSMPTWSPDGKLLTFHVYPGDGAIIVAQANGEGREEVAAHWGSPRWTADPRYIVSIFKYRAFAVLDLKTGDEQVIALAGGSSPYPGFDLSADGKRICYGDASRGGLVVADVDEKYRLSNFQRFLGSDRCTFCSWSPDAKRVVFSKQMGLGAMSQLFILDVDSGDPPDVLIGQSPAAANVNPQWSPDGEWIIYSSDLPE